MPNHLSHDARIYVVIYNTSDHHTPRHWAIYIKDHIDGESVQQIVYDRGFVVDEYVCSTPYLCLVVT